MCICDRCNFGDDVCLLDRDEWDDEPQEEEDCGAFLDSNLAAEEEYWARYNWIENKRYED